VVGQQVVDPAAVARVEPDRRLVQDQQVGRPDQRGRGGQDLAHARGVGGGQPVGHAAQAEQAHHPVDLGVGGLRPAGDQDQVFAAGEPRRQGRGLDQAADPPRPGPGRRPGVAAQQPDLAGVGPQQPEGDPQGGRLAGPVRPDQPVQLALVDPQVEVGKHHGSPEAPVHAPELDRRRGRPPLLRRGCARN
jgi:hypothetical protein